MNPITPGKYLTRDGGTAVVTHVDNAGPWPVNGFCGDMPCQWSKEGRFLSFGKPSQLDLVSRIDDAPNPLIAPLEWALGQLEESLDPDWQAAYKAATEALKLAKQK